MTATEFTVDAADEMARDTRPAKTVRVTKG
jgi:hypothetical protein